LLVFEESRLPILSYRPVSHFLIVNKTSLSLSFSHPHNNTVAPRRRIRNLVVVLDGFTELRSVLIFGGDFLGTEGLRLPFPLARHNPTTSTLLQILVSFTRNPGACREPGSRLLETAFSETRARQRQRNTTKRRESSGGPPTHNTTRTRTRTRTDTRTHTHTRTRARTHTRQPARTHEEHRLSLMPKIL
jgi:hypothetical protein